MELFLIPIKKDTVIYRGLSDKNKIDGNWFVYDIESTKQYGNEYNEYKVKKDLKLINLTSGIFQMHFMEQLNLKYTGDNYDGFDMEKFKSLIPIGLPTLESQKYIIQLIEKEIEKITKNKIESIKFFNENDIVIEGVLVKDIFYT